MKHYSEITNKYLLVHKKRTILTILGIILSVALITAVGTMFMSLRDKMIKQAITNTGDYYVSFSGVDGGDVNKIKSNIDVKTAGVTDREGAGIVNVVTAKEKEDDKSAPPYRYLIIKGYDLNGFKMLAPKLKAGRLPRNSNEIAIDYWALDYFPGKPKVGDKIKMDTGIRKSKNDGTELSDQEWDDDEIFHKTGEKEYTIVGLLDPQFFVSTGYISDGATCIDNINTAGKSYNVYVKTSSMNNIESKASAITSRLTAKPKTEYNNDLLRYYAKGTNQKINTSLLLAVAFIILLIIVCTIAVIYNAFNISVLERISQFGVLRCVGTTPKQIKKIVFKEAAIMSIIGIPIGLIIGIFAMKLVLYIVGFLNFGLLVDVKIVISPAILILSSILGIITVFLSAAGPARLAARVSPMEAVRNSGSVRVEKIRKVKKYILSRFIFGVEGQFASRNLRRNKKRFRITIFSMIISIVLFIVFGSLMDYTFKISAAQTDTSVISYQLYEHTGSSVDDSIYKELSNMPAVKKVYKYYQFGASIPTTEDKINPLYENLSGSSIVKKKGNSREIGSVDFISYGDDNLDALKKSLISGSIDKDAMNKENGIILVQTADVKTKDKGHALIDITKYKVGDEISMPDGLTKDGIRLKVMAILDKGILYNKYNENEGLVIYTTENMMKKVFNIKDSDQLLIEAKPNVSHNEISDYLAGLRNKNPHYFYNDYEAMAKQNRNDNITISIFLYGFIGVIVLIGCLNIENTISTNLILRTKEFAMLKAVGMTKGGIQKMIILEGVFYGLMAAFYGGVLGTLLYYGLFRILNGIQQVEWAMPWKNILISIIGAITAAIISSLIPMKRINSGVIVEDLRVDN